MVFSHTVILHIIYKTHAVKCIIIQNKNKKVTDKNKCDTIITDFKITNSVG